MNVTHLKLKSLQCDACGKQFASNQGLLNHHHRRHKEDQTFQGCQSRWACQRFQMTFKTSDELKQHLKNDPNGLKSLKCNTNHHQVLDSEQPLVSHSRLPKCGQLNQLPNENQTGTDSNQLDTNDRDNTTTYTHDL